MQPTRWKTLSRRDPEFLSYLEGRFSEEYRALPMRSLNVGTPTEEVTFEIVTVESVRAPNILRVLIALARPASAIFSIGPMLATFFYLLAGGGGSALVRFDLALSAFVGVLAFHIAINLFNDYGDHMKGQDRVRPHGGSRAIQRGWVRAVDVRSLAWVLIAVSILCGLPALLSSPVIVMAGVALLIAIEFAFQRLRLKARGWAEILAFAMAGPLLTSAYAWSVTDVLSWGTVGLGFGFGSIALTYFHLANFENIMPDSQAGASTWATRAGFESSKRFFYFTAGLVVFATAYFIVFSAHDARLAPVVIAQLVFLGPVCLRVARLRSPLASELIGLRNEAVKLSWLTLVAFIAGFLWMRAGA